MKKPRYILDAHADLSPLCTCRAVIVEGRNLGWLRDYILPDRPKHGRELVCHAGHRFTPQNTRKTAEGRRVCRTCQADRAARRRKAARDVMTKATHQVNVK